MSLPEWKQYLCRACGLIYDEALGDPDSGIAPGTRFADIPADWVCPLCGVGKADFEPYVPRTPQAPANAAAVPADNGGVVVVGGGMAGWAVAEALRTLDKHLPIKLISACAADRYHKPELSVAISCGMNSSRLIKQTAADAAQALNVQLLAHTFVINIDNSTKTIHTTRGDFRWDKLVLAAGAAPALPPALPPDLCWRVNQLGSFDKLFAVLAQKPQHIAVVGAGMIGTELAEDMARAGHSITLLDRTAHPLGGLLPPQAGKKLQAALADQGVAYLGQTHVQNLNRLADGRYQLRLQDGSGRNTVLLADQVVAATGLAVDSRLPERAGVLFHPQHGIVVDERSLQTSRPDIYALGDCIGINGQSCRFIAPLRRQAETIAAEITGTEHSGYAHTDPVVRLKTRSMGVEVQGRPQPDAAWQVQTDNADTLVLCQPQTRGQNVTVTLTMNRRRPAPQHPPA